MRSAVIDSDGLVVNVIVGDNYDPPPGLTVIPLADGTSCAPGWTYDGTTYIPSPADAPTVEQVNRATLRDRAETALATNANFIAIASPTNAQTLAQVKALTRQNTALIRLVIGKLDGTD